MLRDKFGTFYSNSGMMLNLFEVEDRELDLINNDIESAYRQYFIDSADVSLDQWEREYGLPKSNLPEDQRRATVKAKMRGYGTVTVNHIKNVCDAYTNGDVDVIEKSITSEFEIKFQSVYGIPPNLDDLKKIIEQIKPAHLGVTYTFRYVVYSQLKDLYSNYDSLLMSGKTYEDLLIGGGN